MVSVLGYSKSMLKLHLSAKTIHALSDWLIQEQTSNEYECHYELIVVPTGIGNKVVIESTYNGNTIDISDYESW